MDFFLTNMQLFTSQDVNSWTGVVWIIVMFLSAVWTLILTAPIHCRGFIGEQDVMLNFYKFVPMKNKIIFILDGLRASTFSENFHFWWTISNMCASTVLTRLKATAKYSALCWWEQLVYLFNCSKIKHKACARCCGCTKYPQTKKKSIRRWQLKMKIFMCVSNSTV